jgi:hypothetical protein
MRRRGFHDDEERDLITAYESGEFRPVADPTTSEANRNSGSPALYAEGCAR